MHKQYGGGNYQKWKNLTEVLTARDLIYSKNQIDTVHLKINKYLGNLNNTAVAYKYEKCSGTRELLRCLFQIHIFLHDLRRSYSRPERSTDRESPY